MALFIDCLYFAFRTAKHHGADNVDALFASRLKVLLCRQPSLRALLDLLQTGVYEHNAYVKDFLQVTKLVIIVFSKSL